MTRIIGALLIVPLLILSGFRIKDALMYRWNCEQHLKRASDANTVETAAEELRNALKYIEKEGLTNGYTSIFVETPDEDVGFWYRNLKESLAELENLPTDSAPVDKSNLLLKLRETLLDADKDVTAPKGISVYPNNKDYALGFVIFGLLACAGYLFSREGSGRSRFGSRVTLIEVSIVVTIVGIVLAIILGGVE